MNTTIKFNLTNRNSTNRNFPNLSRRTSAAPIACYDREANRRAIAIARAAAIEVLG